MPLWLAGSASSAGAAAEAFAELGRAGQQGGHLVEQAGAFGIGSDRDPQVLVDSCLLEVADDDSLGAKRLSQNRGVALRMACEDEVRRRRDDVKAEGC